MAKKEQPRKCPNMGGNLCIQEECHAWWEDVIEEHREGQKAPVAVLKGECVQFFWIPHYLRAIAARQDGTQRKLEEIHNSDVKGLTLLGTMAKFTMQRREKDEREALPG